LSEREIKGLRDLRKRIEGRDGMPVFHPGEIAAEQTGTFFDITLRITLLQPITPDRRSNLHACLAFKGPRLARSTAVAKGSFLVLLAA
jgi:hypothetical protein